MRARSREINIFNMSLLDILCGALGAFCFMLLVLLPYYKPANENLRKQEATTQDLLKQLEKLKDAAKDSALAQQMAEMIQKLQEQIKQLQGQVNQFAAQNQQLQTENQALTAKNEKQARTLEMRHPFLAMAFASPPQEIDLYLQSNFGTEDGRPSPSLDLTKHQDSFFTGDRTIPTTAGVTVWMTRDAPVGVHFKVYVKLAAGSAARMATSVSVFAYGDSWNLNLPAVTLTPARFWTLVGTLTAETEDKLTFKEATQAERDDEWRKLSKTEPPSASAASPAAQPNQRGISAKDIEDIIKAREKAQQERQSPPGAAPTSSP